MRSPRKRSHVRVSDEVTLKQNKKENEINKYIAIASSQAAEKSQIYQYPDQVQLTGE